MTKLTQGRKAPTPVRQATAVPDEPSAPDHAYTLDELLAVLDPAEAKAALEVLDAYLRQLKR
jgi:hypothetical protein